MGSVILLVDDEEDFLSSLREFVAREMPGYRTVGATSIESAEQELAALDAVQLSLVCVDHVLEGQRGLDFLESVHQRYPAVPSLLYTGRAEDGVEARALRAGIPVLWKPTSLFRWLQVVRGMIRGPS
jgi:DNA-binding NtrC family response regulator